MSSPKAGELKDSLGSSMFKAPALFVPPNQFLITNITASGNQVTVSWNSNSPGPYQVLSSPSLTGPWSIQAEPTILLSESFPAFGETYWKVRAAIPLLFLNTNNQSLTWQVPTINMADTLQPFNVWRRTTAPVAGDPIDVAHGWTNLATVAATVRQYQDTTPVPAGGFYYGLTQVTVNGANIPYPTLWQPAAGSSPRGFLTLVRNFGPQSGSSGATIILRRIAIDSAGNVIVVGNCSYTTSFGQVQGGNTVYLTSVGSTDAVVAKYSPDGTCLWSFRCGLSSSDVFNDVVIDSQDNICVIGNINMATGAFGAGNYDYGFGTEFCQAAGNILVVKFSPNGTPIWHKLFGGSGGDDGITITRDSGDNLWIAGTYGFFGSGVDFGAGVLAPIGGGTGTGAYLVKLNGANGAHGGFQKAFGASGGSTYVRSVRVGSDGHPVILGEFLGSADFGGGTLTSGGYDTVLAKYNSSTGAVIFINHVTGDSPCRAGQIAIDSANRIWAAGDFVATQTFAPGQTLTAGGSGGFYLVQFSSTGAWVRGRGISSDGDNGPHFGGVAVDSADNVLVTGEMVTGIDFGEGFLLGEGGNDVFLLKYNSALVLTWSRRGAHFGTGGYGVTVGPGDKPYFISGSGPVGLAGFYRIPAYQQPAVLDPPASVVRTAGVITSALWAEVTP